MPNTEHGQARAVPGGERGPNGEWYKGGAFIATTDAPKAPARVDCRTPEQIARDAARQAADAARAAKFAEWLAARRPVLEPYYKRFLAVPYGVSAERWADMLANGNAGFIPNLARELRDCGYLTPRQAHYFAREIYPGRGRADSEKRFDLEDLLTMQPESERR